MPISLEIYWPPRAALRQQSVSIISSILKSIYDADDLSSTWYKKGSSSPAKKNEITYSDASSIDRAITINKSEDGVILDDLGFYFSAWNGQRNGDGVSLECHFGATSPYSKNYVLVNFGASWTDRDRDLIDLIRRVSAMIGGNKSVLVRNGDVVFEASRK